MKKEQWKAIEGFEKYEVSDLGRVRNIKTGRILTQRSKINDYMYVRLLSAEGKQFARYTHRLVASAFVRNTCEGDQVNHKDEDKMNNRSSNLEWCSCRYNINYGTRTLRAQEQRQERCYKARRVVRISEDGEQMCLKSLRAAARFAGVSKSTLFAALNGTNSTAGGYRWRYAEEVSE